MPPRLDIIALAGASNMTSACVTNPIDVIKVRMQLDGELKATAERQYGGWITGLAKILKTEGPGGLYKVRIDVYCSAVHFSHRRTQGLPASLMREGSYSSIRLGLYEPVKEMLGATDPSNTPLYLKIGAGAMTGAVGSAVATPTDLVKVRMQADAGNRYAGGTLQAFREIWRDGGVRALYRGIGPTVQRAALLTATQIPAYDHTKHVLLNHKLFEEGWRLHFVSSMVAGFATAVVTSPVDVLKTRVMNSPQYSSSFQALGGALRTEGVRGLYKGLLPNFLRIGPHTLIAFSVFEYLRRVCGIRPI